jgi:hypothetical protein
LKKLTEQVLERDRENSLFWWNGSSGWLGEILKAV